MSVKFFHAAPRGRVFLTRTSYPSFGSLLCCLMAALFEWRVLDLFFLPFLQFFPFLLNLSLSLISFFDHILCSLKTFQQSLYPLWKNESSPQQESSVFSLPFFRASYQIVLAPLICGTRVQVLPSSLNPPMTILLSCSTLEQRISLIGSRRRSPGFLPQ